MTESDKIDKDASSIVSGMSFFVVFFHLVYRASERSIRTLLIFFQLLFQFLAKTLRNPPLQQVSLRLPKTLYCACKMTFRESCKCVEYVVCPKCNSIYLHSDCVNSTRGGGRIYEMPFC